MANKKPVKFPPEPDGKPESIVSFADRLDWLRERYVVEDDEQGERTRRELPRHEGDFRIVDNVRRFMIGRGQFFRAPLPYFFDRVEKKVYALTYEDKDFDRFLSRLRLLKTQPDHKVVAKDLERIGYSSREKKRYSFFAKVGDATYIYATATTMFKVTEDGVEVVDIGTDGVIVVPTTDQNIEPFCGLDVLKGYMDKFRSLIGKATISPIPESPMSMLTTRWSKNSVIAPDQAQALFQARLLFCAFSHEVLLWPLVLVTGQEASGKSALLEMWFTFLYGGIKQLPTLPADRRSFLASATNRQFFAYENIDRANLGDSRKTEYSDVMCRIATGGEIDHGLLFKNKYLVTFSLFNHCFFTSREYPFPASHTDVARRILHFEVERDKKADDNTPKFELLRTILDARMEILAEYVLRCQNILKALRATEGKTYRTHNHMSDYETWCYRCAEYEGEASFAYQRGLWQVQTEQYLRDIQANNRVRHALAMWIGKNGRSKDWVRAEVLFDEIQDIFTARKNDLGYTSAAQFGIHIGSNRSALHDLGIEKKLVHKVAYYKFNPNDEVLNDCAELYGTRAAAPTPISQGAVEHADFDELERFADEDSYAAEVA
jgi:hypothetical protein